MILHLKYYGNFTYHDFVTKEATAEATREWKKAQQIIKAICAANKIEQDEYWPICNDRRDPKGKADNSQDWLPYGDLENWWNAGDEVVNIPSIQYLLE